MSQRNRSKADANVSATKGAHQRSTSQPASVHGVVSTRQDPSHHSDSWMMHQASAPQAVANSAAATSRRPQQSRKVGNADITLLAQSPKVSPYRLEIRRSLAQMLGVTENQVNIKATTTEHLGFIGRSEGLAAQAVVLLEPAPDKS